jgi:hypothetical protein
LNGRRAAALIEPGSELSFHGTLVFREGRHGAVGRTLKVQQLHTLRHNQLPGTPLGTYTSPDCIVTVGGKVYPRRWAKP